MQEDVTTVDHPLVQHKLTIMRDKNTPTAVACCGKSACCWPTR